MVMDAWCCGRLCQRLCCVGARGCVGVPADVLVDGGMSAHHMSEDVWWLCWRMCRKMCRRISEDISEVVGCTGGCTGGCLVITL